MQLIQGDCLEIMKDIPDKSIDMVLTDPPYGLNFPYNSYDDTRDNLKNLISKSIPEMLRISNRVYILCGPTQICLYPEPEWIISFTWNTTGSFGKYGYNQWTPVLCYGKDLKGMGKINNVLKSDVLRISGGGGVGFMRNDDEKKHTCPKPITMINEIIKRLSNENDTILDCFMGSGTTGVACKNLNRDFIGIELDETYFKIAKERIENTPNQITL
jgi:site-specific DNA-methyltransferase (adenine-specific)